MQNNSAAKFFCQKMPALERGGAGTRELGHKKYLTLIPASAYYMENDSFICSANFTGWIESSLYGKMFTIYKEPMRILIIEDEPKVAAFIKKGLREEGWSVDVAADGVKALAMIGAKSYDVIALDIMLPGRDGLSVLRMMRRHGDDTPVLLLTARDAVPDRVAGLNAGADDYLVKPFAFEELLARLQALVRRSRGAYGEMLRAGDLKMDTARHIVQRAGRPVALTTVEYRLLEYLLRNKGRVLSRVDIEEAIWGLNDDADSNVVDVYINHLRKKIDRPFHRPLIHTVRGFGYKLEHQDHEADH